MVWPTKDVGDISDMLQMKTSSWLSQCMTTMAGLFITIAANVQDVASEMRHIHIGSTSDEEEEEDEEEEKEAMEKEPHLIQMRLALADISENLLTLLSCVHYQVCVAPGSWLHSLWLNIFDQAVHSFTEVLRGRPKNFEVLSELAPMYE